MSLDVTTSAYNIRFGGRFSLSLQRTLRVPDDGQVYPLPPGLGAFPLYRIEDFADRVPSSWRERGGAFVPLYQREALWLGFEAASWKPNAVKIAVGGINVLSGEPWDLRLRADPQDYVVCPPQPWLDGINTGTGSIRQFVAMPLGYGYTLEQALAGAEEIGGIQVAAFEPKAGHFPEEEPPRPEAGLEELLMESPVMGVGAGGTIRQKIYPDPFGLEVWDQDTWGEILIHLINSQQFSEITGLVPLTTPIDVRTYTEHRLPWFDLYDEEESDIPPSERLAGAGSIAAKERERGGASSEDRPLDVPGSQIRKMTLEETREPRRK